MEIKIDRMIISHFKGIRSLEVSFGNVTNVYGGNATGKTTIMDAFLWVLFGKDSTDRKEFEIKHISQNGYGVKDAEVTVHLLANGIPMILTRSYREKWQKKRGSAETEFTGHETVYFINEVPLTMKEYQGKVAEICNEDIFKLITNPAYFPGLKWQSQREILFEIAGGEITDHTIIAKSKEFESLVPHLSAGKSIDEYKRHIGAQKKRIKTELDLIPARIDEVNRSIPAQEDWKEIEKQVKAKEKALKETDEMTENSSKAYQKEYDRRTELQKKLHKAKTEMADIYESYKRDAMHGYREKYALYNTYDNSARALEIAIRDLTNDIQEHQHAIDKNVKEREKLRPEWHKVTDRMHNPDGITCPNCAFHIIQDGQQTEQEFNHQKAIALKEINDKGMTLKAKSEDMTAQVIVAEAKRDELMLKMDEVNRQKQAIKLVEPVIDDSSIPGYQQINEDIKKLQDEYDQPISQVDTDNLRKQKAILQTEIQTLQHVLSLKDQIEKGHIRIADLEQQQKSMSQELADLENIEFAIAGFERAKVDAIEAKVNGMFTLVTFRLFETQINGQEVPTCQATHKKVPYSDLNSAARTNIGIDIINTISKHYGIKAPIFIDNREGVNEIIDTPSQLINLIVTKDKTLVVTSN